MKFCIRRLLFFEAPTNANPNVPFAIRCARFSSVIKRNLNDKLFIRIVQSDTKAWKDRLVFRCAGIDFEAE